MQAARCKLIIGSTAVVVQHVLIEDTTTTIDQVPPVLVEVADRPTFVLDRARQAKDELVYRYNMTSVPLLRPILLPFNIISVPSLRRSKNGVYGFYGGSLI